MFYFLLFCFSCTVKQDQMYTIIQVSVQSVWYTVKNKFI